MIKTIAMKIAVTIGALFTLVVIAIAGIRLASDGPVAMLPGGPMSGVLATDSFPEIDNAVGERIELQVNGWYPSSRTVLGFMHDGNLYVPSVQAEKKWWPKQVLEDPEVLVRRQGTLYPRTARRITDPLLISQLREAISNAETLASSPEMMTAETTWYFRLDHR